MTIVVAIAATAHTEFLDIIDLPANEGLSA
jgi:hypothetical protein